MNGKRLTFLALMCALSGALNAQEQGEGTITEDVFYQHLALAFSAIGPTNCAKDAPAGFSSIAPCNSIEGVDPAKAEFFASDYLEYSDQLNAQVTEGLCGANLTVDEMMERLVSNAEAVRDEKVEYFQQRGEELLGPREFQTMLEWGNKNLRPSIRGGGMGLTDPQVVRRIKSGEIPSEGLQDMICSVKQ